MNHQFLSGQPLFAEPCIFDKWFNSEGKKLIEEIMFSPRNKCFICKAKGNITRHHIIPLHCGGLDLQDNIVYLCVEHHKQIHKFNKDQKNDFCWYKIIQKMRNQNIYKVPNNSNNNISNNNTNKEDKK